jgi:hypothetical protein
MPFGVGGHMPAQGQSERSLAARRLVLSVHDLVGPKDDFDAAILLVPKHPVKLRSVLESRPERVYWSAVRRGRSTFIASRSLRLRGA